MSALATLIANLSTALDAVTGFVPYLPNREPSDTDGTVHRKFKIRPASGTATQGPLMSGGTQLDVFRTIELLVHYNPEGAESTIEATICNDELSIWGVMLNSANWTGARTLEPGRITREDPTTTEIVLTYEFEARYSETVALV